jgi:hypothetical protein
VLEDNRRRRAEFLRPTEAAEPFLHSGTPRPRGVADSRRKCFANLSIRPASTKDCRAGAQGIEALQRPQNKWQAADVIVFMRGRHRKGGDSFCRVSDQGVASARPSHMSAWNKQVRARLDQVVEAIL